VPTWLVLLLASLLGVIGVASGVTLWLTTTLIFFESASKTATDVWSKWRRHRRPLHERLADAESETREEPRRRLEPRERRLSAVFLVSLPVGLSGVVLSSLRPSVGWPLAGAGFAGAIASMLSMRRSIRRRVQEQDTVRSEPRDEMRPQPDTRRAKWLRLAVRLHTISFVGLALSLAGLLGLAKMLLVTPSDWTRVERAELIETLPTPTGDAPMLRGEIWLETSPPQSKQPWYWIELWKPGKKLRVVHLDFDGRASRGVRILSSGDLFDPSRHSYAPLPKRTFGTLSKNHVSFTIPRSSLPEKLCCWRLLTLDPARVGDGDIFPPLEEPEAPIVEERPSEGLGGIRLRGMALSIVRSGRNAIVDARANVDGDIPEDATILVSLFLWSRTTEIADITVLLGPLSNHRRPIKQLNIHVLGNAATGSDLVAARVRASLIAKTLRLHVPVRALPRTISGFRLGVMAHSPRGGGGFDEQPRLTSPPLPISKKLPG
jgi:hypothetical protein